ncbi:MAG: OsmC family protein [Firmicutes bacterium]|nr:OsmC family protein [Bacillota bacterium]
MAKTVVTHKGKMLFEGNSPSGHQVFMDASPDVGGENKGVRPMEMVLLGLGGCTGIDVISILNKMRVAYEAFDMEIEADRAEDHPKIYEHIRIRYRFQGDEGQQDKFVRAVTLSQEKYCSVSAMLAATARIDASVEINGTVVTTLSHGGAPA